jgi:hypothetical protein
MFRLLKSAAKRSFGRSRAAKAAASDPLRFDLEAFRRREEQFTPGCERLREVEGVAQ